MYLNIPYKIFYDTEKFPFRVLIEKLLETNDLENIHNQHHYDLLERKKDQSTIWHKKYYEKFDTEFKPLYTDFVSTLKNYFGYKQIIYQSIPTFRVQLANGNIAVGEWHKDKSYNHGVTEVNFWLPFVDTNEKNSVWVESEEDKGDYKPYTVKYGEILVFNGANLKHGNVNNDSKTTRISMDFRLVDPDKFISNENGSINMNAKFKIGEYFSII